MTSSQTTVEKWLLWAPKVEKMSNMHQTSALETLAETNLRQRWCIFRSVPAVASAEAFGVQGDVAHGDNDQTLRP